MTDAQRLAEELRAKRGEENSQFTAMLFCPVCCSTEDVEGTGVHTVECGTCDTTYIVVVEEDKIRTHAMH